MAQEQGLVAIIREDGWTQVVTERRDACGDCVPSHCCASFGSSSDMVIKTLNSQKVKALHKEISELWAKDGWTDFVSFFSGWMP